MKCLEIGPGKNPVNPSWDFLDMSPSIKLARQASDRCYVAQWGMEKLPIEDERYNFVFASHVLEHVPWFKTVDALKEVLRILKPGGEVEIWVPDFQKIVRAYLAGECGDGWRRYNNDGDFMTWVNGRIFTYGPGDENWHRACFDEDSLESCLVKAGFKLVGLVAGRRIGKGHGVIELGMRGKKLS